MPMLLGHVAVRCVASVRVALRYVVTVRCVVACVVTSVRRRRVGACCVASVRRCVRRCVGVTRKTKTPTRTHLCCAQHKADHMHP